MGMTQRLDQLKSPIVKLRLPSYKKKKDQETPTNTSHPKKVKNIKKNKKQSSTLCVTEYQNDDNIAITLFVCLFVCLRNRFLKMCCYFDGWERWQ